MPCMGWNGHQWSSKLGDGLLPPRLSPAYVIVDSVYSIHKLYVFGMAIDGWEWAPPPWLEPTYVSQPTERHTGGNR